MIKLVQHALSLFGLGIVRVPLDGGQAGSLLAPAAGSFDMEEWSEAMAHSIDSSRHLTTGDGLLCDTTLAALSLFRFEFAEPLVHLPQGEEAVLSSSLLAALLSIVVGARGKMSALGEETPKDPFERRAKFLLAVQGFAVRRSLQLTPTLSLIIFHARRNTTDLNPPTTSLAPSSPPFPHFTRALAIPTARAPRSPAPFAHA